MRHTIASRCSKLCFCAIPSDKNHLCNGSLQQSKDVILRANQNSEYLERMHFVFIIRIISTKFIVEKFFCKWSPAGRDSLSSCNYDRFFSKWSGCSSRAGIWQRGQQSGKIFFCKLYGSCRWERISFQYILGGQKDFWNDYWPFLVLAIFATESIGTSYPLLSTCPPKSAFLKFACLNGVFRVMNFTNLL